MAIKFNCLLILLFLFSCSSINNTNINSIYQNFKIKESNFLINEKIKSSRYAMQYFTLNNINYLAYLESVEDTDYIWEINQNFKIITNGNKIIKTVGLENDFSLSNCSINFSEIMKLISNEIIRNNCLLRFRNPDSSYLEINYKYSLVKKGKKLKVVNNYEYDYRLVEESFEVPLINFKGKNYYWIDNNGIAWESKQILSPKNGLKVRTTLVKSYSR